MIKKYFNKELYQENKKTIFVAILTLVIGIVVSSFLIYFGVTEKSKLKQLNIEKQELNQELISYEIKKNEEYLKNGLSDEYYLIDSEIDDIKTKIKEIDSDISKENSGIDKRVLFVVGGVVIIIAILIIDGWFLIKKFKKESQPVTAALEEVDEFSLDCEDAEGLINEDEE